MKCFGHTPKHPFPQRRDLNFSLKYEKPPLAKQKAARTTNFVSYIITPPLFAKIQVLRPLDDLKAKDAAVVRTQTSLT